MRVAIIGAGLQCRRRAPVVARWPGAELVVITSHDGHSATDIAREFGCESGAGWTDVVQRDDIDVVIVATPPDTHAPISHASLISGKDVLCEKPLTRTLDEARLLVATAESSGRVLKCGFNHRHHPAVRAAHQLFASGALGRPIFGREDYVRMARAKGLSPWRIMLDYSARNAILPNLTGFAMQLGFILGGSILVEYTFSYPGLGYLFFTGTTNHDLALQEALFLFYTLAVLLCVLVADFATAWLDPRTRDA